MCNNAALNARHVIMGAALAPWVNRLPPWQRVLSLAYLSDPNFADSQTAFKSGRADLGRLLGGGLILWLNWIVGTAIGVLGGGLLGAPDRFGIDVVMVCFFTAVVTEQLREGRDVILPVLVAAVVSVVSLPWLATGWNVILGALAAGIAGIATGGSDTDRAKMADWIVVAMVAAITLASRLLGATVMIHVRETRRVGRFLDGLSVGVIAALVASFVAQADLRTAFAVAVTGLTMLASKSAVWAMLSGMAVATAWRWLGAG